MSTPTQLLFGKKIIARFEDGTSKLNLGIASVVALLAGAAGKIPVVVDADEPEAMDLLQDVAASAGRTITGDLPEDIFLAPVAEPVTEQPTTPTVAAAPVGPKPRQTRGNGKVPKAVRLYENLSTTFMRGSFLGQVQSVFKTREDNPAKIADFKAALAKGDCNWDKLPLSKAVVAKLEALGIDPSALGA